MRHRVIDGFDEWRSPDGTLALGHLHFWITPEEVGERQPVTDGGVAVSWDGRLDNREELGRLLGLEKGQFEKLSDAQLVLRAYRRWGEGLFERLLGPFAVAVADSTEGRVLLGRDAVGERTLFYYSDGQRLAAASEAWPVLVEPAASAELDDVWLACSLALTTPTDGRTAFRGVSELQTGTAMMVSGRGERVWRHWTPDLSARVRHARDEDYVADFRGRLRRAVRRRMRSATQPAIFMSGGLDSTPVAAMAAEALAERPGAKPLRSYSYVFPSRPDVSERHYIEAVAAKLGLDAVLVPFDDSLGMTEADLWAVNPSHPDWNPYRALMDRLYTAASAGGGRLMLAGYAGDLLYSGAEDWLRDFLLDGRFGEAWSDVRQHLRRHGWRAVLRSRSIRRLYAGPLDRLNPRRGSRAHEAAPWLTREAAGLVARQPDSPPWVAQAGRPARHRALLDAAAAASTSLAAHYAARSRLEIADPYRDRELIAWVLGSPGYVLYRHGWSKWVTRHALRDRLPDLVVDRAAPTDISFLLENGWNAGARGTVRSELVPELPTDAARSQVRAELKRFGNGFDTYTKLSAWYAFSLHRWMSARPMPRPSPKHGI